MVGGPRGDIVEVPASWDGYRPLADGATLDELAAPYAYRETDGTCVGRHRGAHFFTIGQRKGLNVGGKPEPLFVIATDVERNVLYVGQGQRHPGLYRRGLRILPDRCTGYVPTGRCSRARARGSGCGYATGSRCRTACCM